MKVAFYAPMKPPGHPTPSGDRRMARLMMQAIARAEYQVFLVSDWRTYDGKGDADLQQKMLAEAEWEIDRIKNLYSANPPNLWFTYHCYYKAPDLIGPAIADHFKIPYVIAEGSRAKKRIGGPWNAFACAAEAAIDAADALLAMTDHDRFALERDRVDGQKIIDLPPFADLSEFAQPKEPNDTGKLRLLTVAMMRSGAKMKSYERLAAALAHISKPVDHIIVGDGPMRQKVEALFPNANFKGALQLDALAAEYAGADVFVWPGVEEAYGMVYLEAQASGLPVVAEDHPGPRSVVASNLVPPCDPVAFAGAIEGPHHDPRPYMTEHHSIDRAALNLRETLGGLV